MQDLKGLTKTATMKYYYLVLLSGLYYFIVVVLVSALKSYIQIVGLPVCKCDHLVAVLDLKVIYSKILIVLIALLLKLPFQAYKVSSKHYFHH